MALKAPPSVAPPVAKPRTTLPPSVGPHIPKQREGRYALLVGCIIGIVILVLLVVLFLRSVLKEGHQQSITNRQIQQGAAAKPTIETARTDQLLAFVTVYDDDGSVHGPSASTRINSFEDDGFDFVCSMGHYQWDGQRGKVKDGYIGNNGDLYSVQNTNRFNWTGYRIDPHGHRSRFKIVVQLK